MEVIFDVIGKVAPPAIAALIATWVGVRLALDRYKKEAMWARKLDAYTKILDALHVCRMGAEYCLEREATGKTRTQEYSDRMTKRVSDAYAELHRVIDTGSLVISREATTYLREKMLPREKDWENDALIDFWYSEEKLMRDALTEIESIARAELKT
jgi:hypothetical protein